MFLVSDTSISRQSGILALMTEDPALSVLLAVIHFEWTIRRAIIALGSSPNVVVRKKLKEKGNGDENYKKLWKEEVFPRVNKRLPEIVKNWAGLKKSFKLRHKLVHGVGSCGKSDYACERVKWAIEAATDVREYCKLNNVDLDSRLPVRRKLHPN